MEQGTSGSNELPVHSKCKERAKRDGSDYVDRAIGNCLFTGANPLLPNAGTFACCVSALGRFVPP